MFIGASVAEIFKSRLAIAYDNGISLIQLLDFRAEPCHYVRVAAANPESPEYFSKKDQKTQRNSFSAESLPRRLKKRDVSRTTDGEKPKEPTASPLLSTQCYRSTNRKMPRKCIWSVVNFSCLASRRNSDVSNVYVKIKRMSTITGIPSPSLEETRPKVSR